VYIYSKTNSPFLLVLTLSRPLVTIINSKGCLLILSITFPVIVILVLGFKGGGGGVAGATPAGGTVVGVVGDVGGLAVSTGVRVKLPKFPTQI
jgi:hypothetical protein